MSPMREKKYILLAFILCLFGCNQLSKDRFVLNGEVENVGAEYVILSYWRVPEGIYVTDTALIANGVFSITDTLCEPALAKLLIGDTILSFYIEPSKVMTLNFSRSNPTESILIGSETDEENKELREKTYQYKQLLGNARFEGMKIRESLNATSDTESSTYKELKDKDKKITREIDSLSNIIVKIEEEFANTHPDSFISAHILDRLIFEGKIDLDNQKQIFDKFSDFIKDSYTGKEIIEKIECQQNTSEKAVAPDFTADDIDGNSLTLSSFRDKSHVLLNFWASWCVPYIESVPFLKDTYTQYQTKGLDIIGISNEENEDEWKDTIEKNNIGEWYHILNKDCMNFSAQAESIQRKYRKARLIVPVYILIDKEGKIVKKWEGYSNEIEEDIKATLENIFKE